jgi:hypothetical protein
MASSILDIFSSYNKPRDLHSHRLASQTQESISKMTVSSSFSENVNTVSVPPLPNLNTKTKNIQITNSNNQGRNNVKMARSIEIDHLKNSRNRYNSHVKLNRPITLLNDDYYLRHQLQNDFDRNFHENLLNGKIKIRLLVFVEDADGSRSNIFDSAKHTSSNININGSLNSKELKKLPKSVLVNNHNSKAEGSSLPTGKIPVNNGTNNSNSNSSSNNGSQASSMTKLNNEMITRMVFGSFPMLVSNRTAIKVHSLK